MVDEGNTSLVVFPIEDQRPPTMVANERPSIPHQPHFNIMFDGEPVEVFPNFFPGRILGGEMDQEWRDTLKIRGSFLNSLITHQSAEYHITQYHVVTPHSPGS